MIAPITARQSSDCHAAGVNIVFFDFDGVIVDSEDLVREAYIFAGVNPPRNVLAHEGGTWLFEQVPDTTERLAVKARKNAYYMQHIAEVSVFPGHDVAWHMNNSAQDRPQRAFIISGAPLATGLWLHRDVTSLFDAMLFGVATPDKMTVFKQLQLSGVIATYVDDQDKYIDLPSGWSFVHYTKGMTSGALCRSCLTSCS